MTEDRLGPEAGGDATRSRTSRIAVVTGLASMATLGIAVGLLHLTLFYRLWALATVLPWLSAIALSRAFREVARAWWGGQLDRARGFQRPGAPVPWGLALVGVAWPAWLLWLAHGLIFGGVDTRPAVMTSISLARYGTLDLTALSRDLRDRPPKLRAEVDGVPRKGFERRGSMIYSGFPIGMVPLAFPVAWAAQAAGAQLNESPVQYHLEKLAASTIVAMSCGLFFLVALRLSTLRVAATAVTMLVAGSAVWTIMAAGLWQHGGVFLWSMVFLLAELLPHEARDGRRPGTGMSMAIQGLAGAQLLLCRPTAVLFVAFLNLWVFARSRPRGLILGLLNVAGVLSVFGFHYWLFGDIRGGYAIRSNSSFGNWHLTAESLLGVLFSPARGLFIYQPWLLLLLAATPLALRDRPGRWEWLPIAGLIAAHTLLIGAWQDWIGGWCWGSRLLAETIPLWLLLLLPGLAWLLARPRGRFLLRGVLVLTFLLHAVTAIVSPSLWHIRFHPRAGEPIVWSVKDSPPAFALREAIRR